MSKLNVRRLLVGFAAVVLVLVLGVAAFTGIKTTLQKAAWTSRFIGTPMELKNNPDMLPVVVAAVKVDGMDSLAAADYLNRELLARLERIEGVSSVSVIGAAERKINILLNQSRLDSVSAALGEQLLLQFQKEEQQLKDAEKQLEESRAELEQQKSQLTAGFDTATEELVNAYAELQTQSEALQTGELSLQAQKQEALEKKASLEEALASLTLSEEQLLSGEKQLADIKAQLDIAKQELLTGEAELAASRRKLEQGIQEIQDNPLLDEAAKEAALAPLQEALDEIAVQEMQLEDSRLLYAAQEESFLVSEKKLSEQRAEFEASRTELTAAMAAVEHGLSQLEAALVTAAENKAQLEQAALALSEKQTELDTQITEATAGLSDTEKKLQLEEQELAERTAALEASKAAALSAADLEDFFTMDRIAGIRINGSDALLLTIEKQSSCSAAEASDSIRFCFEALSKENPALQVIYLMDQGFHVDIVVRAVWISLLIGAMIAATAALLYFHSCRVLHSDSRSDNEPHR